MKTYSILSLVLLIALLVFPPLGVCGGIVTNDYDINYFKKNYKDPLNDPRTVNFAEMLKQHCKKETWEELAHDIGKAKEKWEKVVGFKTPDIVGKIAPEIKPGKYTLADKSKLPFDELMPAAYYERWNEPGGQGINLAGNYTEIEIIPSRQLFQNIAVSEATLKNKGVAQLDEKGYLRYETLKPGVPFPRPSGPHNGWQVVYNSVIEYSHGPEDFVSIAFYYGVDKKFRKDYEGILKFYQQKLSNRVKSAPTGEWYDKRAKEQRERFAFYTELLAPRDQYGSAYVNVKYQDPKRSNMFLFYTTLTRRVRKMTGSDTQDQWVGTDISYDDSGGFDQKLSPKYFPYEIKIIDEREYLVPAYSIDGAEYVDSKDKWKLKSAKFERRPMYVVEMKQLNSSYIYSKRILYIDKETFVLKMTQMHDQKGRLWREMDINFAFVPETGEFYYYTDFMYDKIDIHSSLDSNYFWIADDLDRSSLSARSLMRMVK